MATPAEIVNLWRNCHDLQDRFMGSLIQASWDVMNEAPETANHANRLAIALRVMLDPESINRKYFLYFLSNPTIQSSGVASTNNDIQFVVNSFYDIIANTEAA